MLTNIEDTTKMLQSIDEKSLSLIDKRKAIKRDALEELATYIGFLPLTPASEVCSRLAKGESFYGFLVYHDDYDNINVNRTIRWDCIKGDSYGSFYKSPNWKCVLKNGIAAMDCRNRLCEYTLGLVVGFKEVTENLAEAYDELCKY
jgi:hypothetical protein